MSLEYKFFDEKRRIYQQFILIDANEKPTEPIQEEQTLLQEFVVDDDIRDKSIELMSQNESPLPVLDYSYPECYPAFDRDFLNIFAKFYSQDGPDCDLLMEKIVFTNDSNAYQIVTTNVDGFGILNYLYLKLPATFNIILKIMECNDICINHFLNSGGLYLLVYFAKDPDCQLIVSQVFLFITKSVKCEINSELQLLPPTCFGDSFDNETDITYESFFQTLLFSENREVQITCLKSIENLFEGGRNEVRSLESIIIDIFNKLIAVEENEHLLPYILEAAYYFDVGIFSREFINICHYIFQKNFEPGLKPALFFISKNMEFICADDETSDFIFEDLFLYIETGVFRVSRLATFDLISFMSKCNDRFYLPAFKNGLFQCISNIFFTFDRAIEDEIDFEFVITKLKEFLKGLIKSGYQMDYENRDADLSQLIESLQPFLDYAYDKIVKLTKRCINLSQRLNGVNTEEEDVSDIEFEGRVVIDDDMRNDYDGHDYV